MLLSTIATLLLPVVALAAPGPIAESKPAKLATRDVYCAIIGNDGPVNCRTGPHTSDSVVTRLSVGNVGYYTCFKYGTKVNGNP